MSSQEPLDRTLDYFNVPSVEEVLSLNNLVIEKTERQGQELLCLCPFHGDSNPSLRVHRDTGLWYCIACGEAGNIVKLVAHQQQIAVSKMWDRLRGKVTVDPVRMQNKIQELREVKDESVSQLRYLVTLDSVERRINANLAPIGQQVAKFFRDVDPWDSRKYIATQMFDYFCESVDEILAHFAHYRPPLWITSEKPMLEFFKQFVVAKEQLVVSLKNVMENNNVRVPERFE